jgi:hypothetical protein
MTRMPLLTSGSHKDESPFYKEVTSITLLPFRNAKHRAETKDEKESGLIPHI